MSCRCPLISSCLQEGGQPLEVGEAARPGALVLGQVLAWPLGELVSPQPSRPSAGSPAPMCTHSKDLDMPMSPIRNTLVSAGPVPGTHTHTHTHTLTHSLLNTSCAPLVPPLHSHVPATARPSGRVENGHNLSGPSSLPQVHPFPSVHNRAEAGAPSKGNTPPAGILGPLAAPQGPKGRAISLQVLEAAPWVSRWKLRTSQVLELQTDEPR